MTVDLIDGVATPLSSAASGQASYRFAYPFTRNHSTASARACLGGVCGKPSSRMALAGSNHILYLAIRTPASGALGGLPVKRDIVSSTCAAASATTYGI